MYRKAWYMTGFSAIQEQLFEQGGGHLYPDAQGHLANIARPNIKSQEKERLGIYMNFKPEYVIHISTKRK